jgi:hypothetical protein
VIGDTLSTLMNGCSVRNRGMNDVTLLFSVAPSLHLSEHQRSAKREPLGGCYRANEDFN